MKGILKVKWHAMYLGMLIKVQSQEGTIKKPDVQWKQNCGRKVDFKEDLLSVQALNLYLFKGLSFITTFNHCLI